MIYTLPQKTQRKWVVLPWKKSLQVMNNKLTFKLQQRKSFLWRVAQGISVFIPFACSNYINVTGPFSSACIEGSFHFVCVPVDCLVGRTGLPQTPVAEWKSSPRVEEHMCPACMTSSLSLYELYFLLRQDLLDKCPSHMWRNAFEH